MPEALARMARRVLVRNARRVLARRAPRLFVAFLAPTTAELGSCGEELAARALRRQGWRLLGRRVQTPFGEVDIVAARGGSLVCVEVKAGRLPSLPIRRGADRGAADTSGNLRFRPRDRLDHHRIARQRRAGHYLARHLSRGRLAGGRVDLVEVAFLARGRRVELAHHPDVTAPPTGPGTPLAPHRGP